MDLEDATLRLDEEGYYILEDALDPREAERLDLAARALMEPKADTNQRYLSMEDSLNTIPGLAPLCTHPAILELAEAVLGEKFILANTVAMKWCRPGAAAGGLHADWPLNAGIPQPWPVLPTGFQAFWMLTDYTADNGATTIVPFSHHSRRPPTQPEYPQEMPLIGKKGDVAVFVNGTWHRSGANTTTDRHRMAANMLYIPDFLNRPRTGWPLVKREVYDQFSPRLQELLERSVEW
ncbi:MAG: phytanoyl-CoA dioxygenase family protein [Candidatus Poribacteria bacterium]|nr:phytanoyl-CoA dioxygenase family protein [Candidatus Poribacteria bacterium]